MTESSSDLQQREAPSLPVDFDEDVRQELRSRLIPASPLPQLVDEAKQSEELHLLFNQLADDQDMKRLLFQQAEELFPTEDNISVPLLYQGRIVTSEGTERRTIRSKTLNRVIAREVELLQQSQNVYRNAFGLTSQDLQEVGSEMSTILAYAALSVLEDNPPLADLVNADEPVTLEDVSQTLAGADGLDLSTLEKFGEAFEEDDGALDPRLREIAHAFAKKAALGIFSLFEGPNTPSSPVPKIVTTAHGPAGRWYPRVLDQAGGLGPGEYRELLDDLYGLNLIRPRDNICWCERCSLKTTSYTKHYGDVAPAELNDENCLACGRDSSYSALYALDPLFRDLLFSEDGFLAVYLGWLLEQAEKPHEANHDDIHPEADFLVDERIVVECKMYRSGRERRQIEESLNAVLGQLRKQIEAREEEGYDIEKAAMVWNEWENITPSGLSYAHRYEELIETYDLEIVGAHEIEEFVDRLT